MKLIDLGWCIARLDEKKLRLTIVYPADENGEFFTPATSVDIHGKSALSALRDALIEAIPD